MLEVPSKTDFCKVPTLYDIPNFFKLHSKSFGMDSSAPVIIVSLSHILAISNRSWEQLSSFSFLFRIRLLSTGHLTSSHFYLYSFLKLQYLASDVLFVMLSTWIQASHKIFTISFSMVESTLCSYQLSHTFTPYFLHNVQCMFKHTFIMSFLVFFLC